MTLKQKLEQRIERERARAERLYHEADATTEHVMRLENILAEGEPGALAHGVGGVQVIANLHRIRFCLWLSPALAAEVLHGPEHR